MRFTRTFLLLVATIALACAPASGRGPMRNQSLITGDELAATKYSNLYDAIQALRPNFLRSRGRNSFDPDQTEFPIVYLDGQRFGEIGILKSMPLERVIAIRSLSASDATTKYGTNNTSGVIEVVTR
jgi:hypothetical protein